MTVVVGRRSDSGQCHVTTLAAGADAPLSVAFDLPSSAAPLQPGPPAWSNYVKGVVANFKGMWRYCGSAVDMFVVFFCTFCWGFSV